MIYNKYAIIGSACSIFLVEWDDEKNLDIEVLETSFLRARDVPSSDLYPTFILSI